MKKVFIYTLIIIITSLNICRGQNNPFEEVNVNKINYILAENLTATVIKGNYYGNITIPEIVKFKGKNYSVREIGYTAFENSSELISIKLPSTIKTIGGRAFENCEKLKWINIPSSVESIQQAVFFHCRTIKTIFISENVSFIGEYAFSFCENLDSIIVDKKNSYFSSLDGVLYDKDFKSLIKIPETKAEYNFPETVEDIKKGAFENCRLLKYVNLPEAVKIIPQGTFDNCFALSKIYIHKNIDKIGLFAFSNCKSLESIIVDGENKKYSSVDGVLYNLDKSNLIFCPIMKSNISIENNTTMIASGAFENCKYLKEIIIPEKVELIGWAAFANCDSLKIVKILSKEKISIQMHAFSKSVIILVPKEIINSYRNSNSLDEKELSYEPY